VQPGRVERGLIVEERAAAAEWVDATAQVPLAFAVGGLCVGPRRECFDAVGPRRQPPAVRDRPPVEPLEDEHVARHLGIVLARAARFCLSKPPLRLIGDV
jgi:hypothetical protein